MTLKEAYNYGCYFLAGNGIDEAEFKAKCLACHCNGLKNNQFKAHEDDDVMMKKYADLLWKVKAGEPLQYVIGKWDFYESEFYVGEGVLIPRPETEELVELAISLGKNISDLVVYDLCAGSGCIGASVAKALPQSTVYCVEKSADAMYYLLKNTMDIKNVKVFNGDINEPMDFEKADIIISNPPYIKSQDIPDLQQEVQKEPAMALDGGKDGLDFYRIINDKWADKLKNNAILLLEIGDEQGEDVKTILTNFTQTQIIKDMNKNDRIVKAIKS